MKCRRLEAPEVPTFKPVTVELTFETPDELVWTLARLNINKSIIIETDTDFPVDKYEDETDDLWELLSEIYKDKVANGEIDE